jgi:hypothetical protein
MARIGYIAAPHDPVDPVTLAELIAFAGRHPILSLALAGITLALVSTRSPAACRRAPDRSGPADRLINRDNAWW